jgi:SAM-dependent methyltransferase
LLGVGWTSKPRRLARQLIDRALEPHVQRIIERVTANPAALADQSSPGDPAGVPSDFFHNLLHAARTAELRRLRGSAQRVLSVGASGSWYFDWFEESVGRLEQHVGVEAFEAMPDDLPDNVRWIASGADSFEGVADGSIDMVFAGQTTEHLWSDELAAFLLEAHRVLAPGGLLVLDSPNRLVTEHLLWSHGGHTVELSADEITALLEQAGFGVVSARGLWRCTFDGQVMALESGLDQPELLVRRIGEAADRVDDSFVWWVVATRTGVPDPDALQAATRSLYSEHWPTRISRGMWPGPPDDNLSLGHGSHLVRSLPVYLRPGQFSITLELLSGRINDAAAWTVRITTPGDHLMRELSLADAEITETSATWSFSLDQLIFAAAIEVHVRDLSSDVQLRMPVHIASDSL